jgi:hypothetical protein
MVSSTFSEVLERIHVYGTVQNSGIMKIMYTHNIKYFFFGGLSETPGTNPA